jgi:hypothetical protein
MTIATESPTNREFSRSRVAGRLRHINIHGANAKIMACKGPASPSGLVSRLYKNCLQSSTRSSCDNTGVHDGILYLILASSMAQPLAYINEASPVSLHCSVQSRVTRRAIDRGGSSVEGWWLANFPSSFRESMGGSCLPQHLQNTSHTTV